MSDGLTIEAIALPTDWSGVLRRRKALAALESIKGISRDEVSCSEVEQPASELRQKCGNNQSQKRLQVTSLPIEAKGVSQVHQKCGKTTSWQNCRNDIRSGSDQCDCHMTRGVRYGAQLNCRGPALDSDCLN